MQLLFLLLRPSLSYNPTSAKMSGRKNEGKKKKPVVWFLFLQFCRWLLHFNYVWCQNFDSCVFIKPNCSADNHNGDYRSLRSASWNDNKLENIQFYIHCASSSQLWQSLTPARTSLEVWVELGLRGGSPAPRGVVQWGMSVPDIDAREDDRVESQERGECVSPICGEPPLPSLETLSRALTPGMLSHSSGGMRVWGCHIYLRRSWWRSPTSCCHGLGPLTSVFSLLFGVRFILPAAGTVTGVVYRCHVACRQRRCYTSPSINTW